MNVSEDHTRLTIFKLYGIKSLDEIGTIVAKVESGFDANTKDSGGRTLLMQAVIERDHELMNFLVKNGCDVNLQDDRLWTALHFAAQNSDQEAVKILLDNNRDVTKIDDYGNSILSTAVFNSKGECDVIKLLLSFGANAKIKNKNGVSAKSLARTISNYNLQKCFEDSEPSLD